MPNGSRVSCGAPTPGAHRSPVEDDSCRRTNAILTLLMGRRQLHALVRRRPCQLRTEPGGGGAPPGACSTTLPVGARSLHHEHRARMIDRGPKLPVAVLTPAIRGARGRDPAGVAHAGAHGGKAHASDDKRGAQPAPPGPVAELALVAAAP